MDLCHLIPDPRHLKVADGVGFEPTGGFHLRRFSRPVPSTARPPIRFAAAPFRGGVAIRFICPARRFSPRHEPACNSPTVPRRASRPRPGGPAADSGPAPTAGRRGWTGIRVFSKASATTRRPAARPGCAPDLGFATEAPGPGCCHPATVGGNARSAPAFRLVKGGRIRFTIQPRWISVQVLVGKTCQPSPLGRELSAGGLSVGTRKFTAPKAPRQGV